MTPTPLTGLLLAALLSADLSRVDALAIEGTNDFRAGERLSKLKRNGDLEEAARGFAEYMARTGKFDHDADGSTPSARAKAAGYDYCIVSENIAYLYSSAGFATADLARRLVELWKNSPGHRRNMVEPDVLDTAVAVAHTTTKGVQRYYAVQMFGRPRSASVPFQVSNTAPFTVRYRVGERAFTLQARQIRSHVECTAQALAFQLADESKPARFTTRSGDKFVVTSEKGAASVRRE